MCVHVLHVWVRELNGSIFSPRHRHLLTHLVSGGIHLSLTQVISRILPLKMAASSFTSLNPLDGGRLDVDADGEKNVVPNGEQATGSSSGAGGSIEVTAN